MNLRSFYRINYPEDDRPALLVEGEPLEILDISETGVRFVCPDELPLGKSTITASIEFRDRTRCAVQGKVYRRDEVAGTAVLRLMVGIPPERMMAEQRGLIVRHGRDWQARPTVAASSAAIKPPPAVDDAPDAREAERKHYRVHYQRVGRPRLVLHDETYAVNDVSEYGVRFACPPEFEPQLGILQASIHFDDGASFRIVGQMLRHDPAQGSCVLRLHRGLPSERIAAEQREQIQRRRASARHGSDLEAAHTLFDETSGASGPLAARTPRPPPVAPSSAYPPPLRASTPPPPYAASKSTPPPPYAASKSTPPPPYAASKSTPPPPRADTLDEALRSLRVRANQRSQERVVYPAVLRPLLTIASSTYAIVDLAPRGVRFAAGEPALATGAYLRASMKCLSDGVTIAISGLVVRTDPDGSSVLKLDRPLPWLRLLAEQKAIDEARER